MELKKFIKEVLLEVTEAVEEAKSEAKLSIAPARFILDNETKLIKEHQLIEFDIGLSVKNSSSSENESDGKIAISVVKIGAGKSKKSNEEKNYDHRIKFSVPVYFQATPKPTKP